MDTKTREDPIAEVAPIDADSRYRLVRFRGHDWEPVDEQEFRAEAARLFPRAELTAPGKVAWRDHPWEWPTWHPGEA
ncbi:hypothetical protein [Kitasatospora viridis]|uniref:Uncharacterized protein n=1 Tax=Kitasatospora viridis TaxID=281105 RepID=A0A561UAB0_9ACTN|nr:hypothetical protein [Kitasatospora viridis]TWF96292.1 hypothetical protein FHX73_1156 [Kitasatospora viridis]